MLKTISKALCIFTLVGLMLWSPLSSAQAANNSFYYISAETDYNENEPIYVVGHKEASQDNEIRFFILLSLATSPQWLHLPAP